MNKLFTVLGVVSGVIILVFVIALVFALPVMLLVNYVFSPAALVAIFGGPIGFWKAFWLNFLCGFLFKSSNTTTSK